MVDFEAKKKKYDYWIKVGIIAAVGLLVSPLIFLIIKGLVGLTVAAVLFFIVLNVAPVFSMKIANWKISALKAEAWKNPVPTLENEYIRKQEGITAYRTALQAFIASIGNMRSKYDIFVEKFPNSVKRAQVFIDQIEKMEMLKDRRIQKLKKANQDLEAFKEIISEAEGIWEMSMELIKMNQAAGFADDPMSEIKTKTALDSVRNAMNTSFAELDLVMAEEVPDQTLAITHQEAEVIPALTSKVPSEVIVQR